MKVENKKIPKKEFMELREEVLASWPTGKDVNLQESFEFHKSLPEHKIFSNKLIKAKKENKTLIQPRAGVALVDEQIKLLLYLQNIGGADLLPTTIDSYTRQNCYDDAQKGIIESIKNNKSMLNGFPAVNHGVESCRRIINAIDTPVQIRHGTPDARLLSEITYAGGFTSFEGGGISYNIPYAKNVSLEKTIKDWQYVDRLTGIYEEEKISINREPYGPLTGTLVPPCISHAVAIIESLLAAEQGVKNISVGYGQCGNFIQDIAAVRSLEELTNDYLIKNGYENVIVTTVLHQWMGSFPQNEAKAFGVIALGSALASLSKSTKVIVKTPHEAIGVPTMEANAQGLLCTKQILYMLKDQEFKLDEVEIEKHVIEVETRCIVDKCFEIGEGDIALGVIRAFKSGILDIPFAPSVHTAGKLLPARDNNGAIRILNPGKLPFNAEILDFNNKKIEERAKFENREKSFQMVIDDVYAISKGTLIGRPRNK
ncbi:methylaspartate mutase subunit E [Terrisporobacter sp.]